jgi:outer membrane protein
MHLRRTPLLRLPSWLRAVALSTVLGGAVLLGATPASAQNAPKVAVIDVRRAVLETEQGLRVQATLKKLFDSRQVELDAKTRQLQADKETLEKEAQQNKISKEAIQKKYEALVKQDAELQRTTLDYQREMQRKEQEMTTPILQGILEAVKRIAAQEGFELVLEKSAVPYFRGDLELTDRAIQMYNSGQASTPKGKPAPAAPAPAAPAPAAPPAAPPAKAPAPAPAPRK